MCGRAAMSGTAKRTCRLESLRDIAAVTFLSCRSSGSRSVSLQLAPPATESCRPNRLTAIDDKENNMTKSTLAPVAALAVLVGLSTIASADTDGRGHWRHGMGPRFFAMQMM